MVLSNFILYSSARILIISLLTNVRDIRTKDKERGKGGLTFMRLARYPRGAGVIPYLAGACLDDTPMVGIRP